METEYKISEKTRGPVDEDSVEEDLQFELYKDGTIGEGHRQIQVFTVVVGEQRCQFTSGS